MSPVANETQTVAPPPPAVSVMRAMLWNWWIVLIAVVIFAGVGATLALVRTPDYTATARLSVGRIDITSPGALSGFAVATQALATGYSRTVTSQAVATEVSEKTGISIKDVQSHVTATPIAESPVFRIEATSPDREQAIALANLSGRALIRYAAKLNRDNPDTARLFAKYRQAVGEETAAEQELLVAEEDLEEREIPPVEKQVDRAAADLEAAELRAEAFGRAYTSSVQSQVATDLVQMISPAIDAESDKRSTFFIYTFIGLVIGLFVGGALAYWREWRLSVGAASRARGAESG